MQIMDGLNNDGHVILGSWFFSAPNNLTRKHAVFALHSMAYRHAWDGKFVGSNHFDFALFLLLRNRKQPMVMKNDVLTRQLRSKDLQVAPEGSLGV